MVLTFIIHFSGNCFVLSSSPVYLFKSDLSVNSNTFTPPLPEQASVKRSSLVVRKRKTIVERNNNYHLNILFYHISVSAPAHKYPLTYNPNTNFLQLQLFVELQASDVLLVLIREETSIFLQRTTADQDVSGSNESSVPTKQLLLTAHSEKMICDQ